MNAKKASLKNKLGHASRSVLALVFLLSAEIARGDGKIWVEAKINDKPIKLALDTGSHFSTLYRKAAENLGLKATWPVESKRIGMASVGTSEQCNFTLWDKTEKTQLRVIDMPNAILVEEAGVLGWSALNTNIICFDCLNQKFSVLSEVPKYASNWLKFDLRYDSSILAFLIPFGPHLSGQATILLDTGNDGGISLNSEQWREWTTIHTKRLKTMDAYHMPGAGLMVQELSWADSISFDRLTLTDVPIREANISEFAAGWPKCVASLGMAALKRMDFIVDGQNGVIYLQPKKTPAPPFEHNRIGAEFVPADLEKPGYFIAHVMSGSPAFEAGIRNGDILVNFDGFDGTNTFSSQSLRSSAITKFKFTLIRGEKEYQTVVLPRELIGPSKFHHTPPVEGAVAPHAGE